MPRIFGRSLVACAAAGALMLACATAADAATPFAIGTNTSGLPSTPAVTVDSSGTLYAVWLDQAVTADNLLNFCKIAAGATSCGLKQIPAPTNGSFFDPPSITVQGSTVRVFEDVAGAANDNQDGMNMFVSTDGGSTFIDYPYAISYTGVGDTAGTTPQPLVKLPNGDYGFGYVSAVQNPLFQANSSTAPQNYSSGAYSSEGPMPPAATLNPSPNTYSTRNDGGDFASQLTGTTGILGVFGLLETGPCPSGDGLVFSYAPATASTTDAQLNTSSGSAGSPWSPLTGLECNAEDPALSSGPAGLGLLLSNESSDQVQYRRFTAPASFGAPAPIVSGTAGGATVNQDGAGGVYATWANGSSGVLLAYSPDGGASWDGPGTLVAASSTVSPNAQASAVDSGGQGWVVYASNGTEYALPFVATQSYATPHDASLKLSPSSFAPALKGGSIAKKGPHRGTRVTYTDSEGALTTVEVLKPEKGYRVGKGACKAVPKHRKAPKRSHKCSLVLIGSFKHQDLHGANSFEFTGRVGGHKLARGSYVLGVLPKLGRFTGALVSKKFKIV